MPHGIGERDGTLPLANAAKVNCDVNSMLMMVARDPTSIRRVSKRDTNISMSRYVGGNH